MRSFALPTITVNAVHVINIRVVLDAPCCMYVCPMIIFYILWIDF